MATYILGVTAYARDSAAALLRDGEIVAAAREASFSRKRGDAAFPASAIEYCLQEARRSLDAVDLVLFCDLLQSGGGLRSIVTALRRTQLQVMLRRELAALAGCGRHTQPPLAVVTRTQALAALADMPEPIADAHTHAHADLSLWRSAAAMAPGAALHYWQAQLDHPVVRVGAGPWLGPWFGGDGIAAWLDEQGFAYRRLDDDALVFTVAQRLLRGESVGWLQGRLEFCERSCGGRSILVAPGAARLVSYLSRQPPLLLVLDAARARDWLQQPAQAALRAQLGDASLQVVTAVAQPRLHRLLQRLADGGLPLLIGFDLRDGEEPLVATPIDAYRCFLRAELDSLVMEDLLLVRREQPLWEEPVGTLTVSRTRA